MTGPGSIQGQLNVLQLEIAKEKSYAAGLERELAAANTRLRLATGIIRDLDKASAPVAEFLRGVK